MDQKYCPLAVVFGIASCLQRFPFPSSCTLFLYLTSPPCPAPLRSCNMMHCLHPVMCQRAVDVKDRRTARDALRGRWERFPSKAKVRPEPRWSTPQEDTRLIWQVEKGAQLGGRLSLWGLGPAQGPLRRTRKGRIFTLGQWSTEELAPKLNDQLELLSAKPTCNNLVTIFSGSCWP